VAIARAISCARKITACSDDAEASWMPTAWSFGTTRVWAGERRPAGSGRKAEAWRRRATHVVSPWPASRAQNTHAEAVMARPCQIPCPVGRDARGGDRGPGASSSVGRPREGELGARWPDVVLVA